jgi:ATP/maltotriose-dependent transcriptional regulator MalT
VFQKALEAAQKQLSEQQDERIAERKESHNAFQVLRDQLHQFKHDAKQKAALADQSVEKLQHEVLMFRVFILLIQFSLNLFFGWTSQLAAMKANSEQLQLSLNERTAERNALQTSLNQVWSWISNSFVFSNLCFKFPFFRPLC